MSVILNLLLVSTFVFADPKTTDVLEMELNRLKVLAARTDLTARELIAYTDSVEARCAAENNDANREKLCSLFFDLYDVTLVFRKFPNGPSREQCDQGLHSAAASFNRQKFRAPLRVVMEKLCPKR